METTLVLILAADLLSRRIDLKSGKIINAWIEYRDNMKMVRVWVSYSSTRPPTPIIASFIDLSERFKEFMHVGFSASNGKGSSTHLVHHWQFKTLSYSHSVSPMDNVEEGDCFLCYGAGDSKASNRKGENSRRKKIGEIALGIGGTTAFVVGSALALIVVICVFIKRKNGV